MAQSFYFNEEQLGRRRFQDNKAARANLNSQAAFVLSALMDLLPSNYQKSDSPNLSQLLRVMAREAGRQNISAAGINDDKVFLTTRIEYLQQILGERLFLSDRIVPFTTNDVIYREFLVSIKNAYLTGSTKTVIEDVVNEFTKLKVNLKELYLEARKPGSAYGLTDTHKMILEVFVDDLLASGRDIATINLQLSFFIDLVRPAHVLYDTKFIWTETLAINKIHDLLFGDTGGGCVPQYVYSPFNERVVLGTSIVVVPPGTTGTDIHRIGSIQSETLEVFTIDGIRVIVEPGTDGTKLFTMTGGTVQRMLFGDLQIGQTIRLGYLAIPGDFNFHYMPPDLVANYQSRFYKNMFRKPAFQEFVRKHMDSKGRFPLQTRTMPTTLCDRWVHDALQPMYEDLRRNCAYRLEEPKTYDTTLSRHMWSPRFSYENLQAIPNERERTGDIYGFTMLPYGCVLTDGHGNPADVSDVSVLVPSDSTKAITGFFTAPYGYVTVLSDTLNLHNGNVVEIKGTLPHHKYDGVTTVSRVDEFSPGFSFAIPGVYDSTASSGHWTNWTTPLDAASIQSIDSSAGYVALKTDSTTGHFDSSNYRPIIGSAFRFRYYYKTTGSDATATTDFVFGIGPWQLPDTPVSTGEGSNVLATESDVKVYVDGTRIPDAVRTIDPILGQVTLFDATDFWMDSPLARVPMVGDRLSFGYHQSGTEIYSMIFDDPARTSDDAMTFDGATLADPSDDMVRRTPIPQPSPLQVGYKFRTDLLHHASVLNSPDTLLLNNYQKPVGRASIVNRQDTLNHFNYFFSPEFLTDTDVRIELNDLYLDKDTPPVTVLGAGTPPFQKTYAYQPALIREKKLQDIRTNKKLLMYSDLLLKEFRTGDDSVPLSSICDNAAPKFKIVFKEELEGISECDPWILFDTADVTLREITLPGEMTGVPNIRIPDMELRENLVLRDTTPAGYTLITSGVYYDGTPADTTYQMPEYIHYYIGEDSVDFPARPLMKDATAPADIGDIVVKVDGTTVSGLVTSVDASTGTITLSSDTSANVELVFLYRIRSTRDAEVMDPDLSRFLDDDYLFPDTGLKMGSDGTYRLGCFDGYGQTAMLAFNEYVNFMSDCGKGIKFKYLNKDTLQIEEHVFTGPVFESYNPEEDEISSPESFPGALIRIPGPLGQSNPLRTTSLGYDFLNDEAVRIRKKTIQELLPDRTFRTIKINEALPV